MTFDQVTTSRIYGILMSTILRKDLSKDLQYAIDILDAFAEYLKQSDDRQDKQLLINVITSKSRLLRFRHRLEIDNGDIMIK